MANEVTGPQLHVTSIDDTSRALSRTATPSTYKLYRRMRRDPTIALVRTLIIAPIVAAGWSIEEEEDAPDGAYDYVRAHIMPMQVHVTRTAIQAHIDYGWIAYEKVFDMTNDGYARVRKLKPLLQDLTEILVDKTNGSYLGLKQQGAEYQDTPVELGIENSLLIALDVEGTDWYGEALIENARTTFDRYETCDAASDRYDKKVAGTHWVVWYPTGQSPMNGTMTDNFTIAQSILQSLESSGKLAVPSNVATLLDDVDQSVKGTAGWKIELLGDTSNARAQFTDRQKYLDTLKVRAFGVPERSVLEGQFGTKAEAEAHGDFAIVNLELKHTLITQHVNWHLVNQMLRINFGPDAEDKVRVVPTPLKDENRATLRAIYAAILGTPSGELEAENIDLEAVRDQLGIPTKAEEIPVVPGADLLPIGTTEGVLNPSTATAGI